MYPLHTKARKHESTKARIESFRLFALSSFRPFALSSFRPFALSSLSPFLLFSLLLFSFFLCSAQIETAPPPQSLQKEVPAKKQRPTFTVGGGVGFQFGFYNSVEVMPMGGVYVKPWLVALVNGQYSYMWCKNFYNSHIWGVGVALEPWIIKRIVVHAGYEYNQMILKWLDGSPKQIQNFHFAVVGVGYKQYLSQKIYFQGLILFNIPLNQPTIQNYVYSYYPYFRVVVGVDL